MYTPHIGWSNDPNLKVPSEIGYSNLSKLAIDRLDNNEPNDIPADCHTHFGEADWHFDSEVIDRKKSTYEPRQKRNLYDCA